MCSVSPVWERWLRTGQAIPCVPSVGPSYPMCSFRKVRGKDKLHFLSKCIMLLIRTLSNHLMNLLFQSSIKLQRLASQKCIGQDMRPFRRPTIPNGPCPTVQSVSASFGVCHMSFALACLQDTRCYCHKTREKGCWWTECSSSKHVKMFSYILKQCH